MTLREKQGKTLADGEVGGGEAVRGVRAVDCSYAVLYGSRLCTLQS